SGTVLGGISASMVASSAAISACTSWRRLASEGGISPRDSFARLYRSMALAYSSLCSLLIMATTLGPPIGRTPAVALHRARSCPHVDAAGSMPGRGPRPVLPAAGDGPGQGPGDLLNLPRAPGVS